MLIIQKYGGSSVGSPDNIKEIAKRIQASQEGGDQVVVVVSAMSDTTSQFTQLAHAITDHPSRREMDMLLTAGERITMALLSMALHDLGVPAISFTGSQTGIITDTVHGEAQIVEVRPIRVRPELDQGKVVIVAGFQGVSREKEVTTLGRGGSDTTAIALAAGLGADICEICTDVPGIMTADPRMIKNTRLIQHLPWNIMEEMALLGAGVMHHRAARMAGERHIPYRVCSTFGEGLGTMVEGMQETTAPCSVLAVTGSVTEDLAAVALVGTGLNSPDIARRAQETLKNIGVEPTSMEPGNLSLRITLPQADYAEATWALHSVFLARG